MVRLIQQPTVGSDLLEQYRQSGSPDLFAQIMRAYGGMVLSVCYKVTKDSADAEDASQATFLTLAVQCKTGAAIQYLGPWLKKVAKRTSLDLVRSRKRRTRRELVTAESRPEHYDVRPGAKPEADELHTTIRAELDELPPKYKMPLVLHYFGGLSHEQISREMKCTPAALGVRLHRARKMLGKRLTAKGISLEGAALGAAIAISVQQAMCGRFFSSSGAVALGLAPTVITVQPAVLSASMTAGVPGHLLGVLQVVTDVSHAMARSRVRMATAALAASISVLGGAAEAVRHLPDSLRPNLEFLSPTKLIRNLFDSPVAVPRLQNAKPAPIAVAAATPAKVDAVARGVVPAPALAAQPVSNQPFLSLQFLPPVAAPTSGGTPVMIPRPNLESAAPSRPSPTPLPPLTPAAAPTGDRSSRSIDRGVHLSGGASGDDAAPETGAATAGGTSGSRRGPSKSIPSAPGEPAALGPEPAPSVDRSVHGFSASAVGGATVNDIPPDPVLPTASPGPAQVPAGPDTFTPDSAVLHRGQTFVHGGTGLYHWSDPGRGITEGGTNAADFALNDALGPGVVTIERLPVTTLLAPARPLGHHFVGIWSLASTVDYASITLTAHYDEAFAESLGLKESVLKLWVYDNATWTRLDHDPSFVRDMTLHTLTATYAGTPAYFAVSAPEPAVLGVLGVASGLLLRRRRASS